MSQHTLKIIAMLDDLAHSSEASGDMTVAAQLDAISALVVTADQEVSTKVSTLADDLQRHFPNMDTERALHVSKTLYAQYGEEENKEDTEEEGDEKEGTFPGGAFPNSALPNRERRQGPRPQDVPIGTPEWWKP